MVQIFRLLKKVAKSGFFAILETGDEDAEKSERRQAIEMLCTDMLLPREYLLQKIDAVADFVHIYELV